jgi:predicted deacylase
VQTRESLGLEPAVIIDGRNPENYVNTDEPGFWENLLEPGDGVMAGDPVGRLWFPDQPARSPRVFTAPRDGVLVVARAMTPTLAGDSVFVLGQPIEASALE